MKNITDLKLINWKQEIDPTIEKFYSSLTLFLWKHYNISVLSDKDNNLYCLFTDNMVDEMISFFPEINKDKLNNNQLLGICQPINDLKSFEEKLPQLIEKVQQENGIKQVIFYGLTDNTLALLAKYKTEIKELNFTANYIYETEALITFSGKKLQKKRNFLNYYLKNYLVNTKSYLIQEIPTTEIWNYLQKKINTPEEFKSYEDLLFSIYDNEKDAFTGLVLKYNDVIIAVTIGYSHNDIYELFIERADSEYRGVFVYLISENLKKNKIENKYIDRQDDLNLPNLIKSKMSYFPLLTVRRFVVLIE